MLKDITIGQYYPVKSLLHSLDPRTKIIFSLFFMTGLFLVNDAVGYTFFGFLTGGIIILSKVPFKLLLKGLRPLILIIILTFLIHIFSTKGEVIFVFGPFDATEEGVQKGAFLVLRLVLLILVTSLLTLTTTPIALTDGIEQLLSPLKKLGFSPHELAMMMSISLRFIPTLIEETEKIMKAQKARGADFERGNVVKRARNLVPILVPLFVGAFRRAEELAVAMEARCYRGGENRTRMKELKYGQLDYICYSLGFLILISALVMRFTT